MIVAGWILLAGAVAGLGVPLPRTLTMRSALLAACVVLMVLGAGLAFIAVTAPPSK